MEANPTQRESRPSAFAALTAFLRKVMVLLIILGLGFLVVWFYAHNRVHEEIRRNLETRLNEHYRPLGFAASLRSARLLEGRGIEFRQLKISRLGSDGVRELTVSVDEIFVSCDVTMQELLSQPSPVAKNIAIRRPHIRAVRHADGQWNLSQLWPLPKFSDNPAPISIENAAIDLICEEQDAENPVRLRNIFLSIAPDSTLGDTPQMQASNLLQVRGTLRADHVDEIKFASTIDPEQGHWTVQGSAENVRVSPALFSSLPKEFEKPVSLLSSLRAQISLQFSLSSSQQHQPFQFSIKGALRDGRIEDSHLPYPLTKIDADFRVENTGLTIDKLTAMSGAGSIAVSGRTTGLTIDSPLRISARVRELELDERLSAALPPNLRKEWDKFSPSGTVDADLALSFDGLLWAPDLEVNCRDVSFSFYKFPYRVNNCLGTITYKENVCAFDLLAPVENTLARFVGQVQNPGAKFTGQVNVALDGPVTINDEIIGALPEKQQQLVRSFAPQGAIKVHGSFGRQDAEQTELDKQMTVELVDCRIKYEKFAYPVERIGGKLEMRNDEWAFQNIEGFNDSGYLKLDGSFLRDDNGGDQLELVILGDSIPLEEDLRLALTPQQQKLWSDLRPRGTLDFIRVVFRYSKARQQKSLDIEVVKQKQDGESLSVNPIWFPYQLDQVTGSAYYTDGQVQLRNIAGRHGGTHVTIDGKSAFSPSGWNLLFEKVTATGIYPNNELIQALPAGLATAVRQTKLTGVLSLQGSIGMSQRTQPLQPPRTTWDVVLDLEDADVFCGITLNDVRGAVRFVGEHDGKALRSRGELNIDSLIHREIQFTSVKGPLWIDDFQIGLGRWASAAAGSSARPVTARLFGGTLESDIHVSLAADRKFDISTVLKAADLARSSRDLATTPAKVSGKANANIHLQGNYQGIPSFRGTGQMQLYDADIYEVPVMLSLLNIMRLQRPDAGAFTTSNMEFHIVGPDIYFDRIDFNGDTFSLRGNGEMNLDRRINLNFYTIVGRNEFLVPLISPILGLASRQILQIHVDGTLDNPNPPVREVLPALNETLRQLFPELDIRPPS